jgi:hypothetical protein
MFLPFYYSLFCCYSSSIPPEYHGNRLVQQHSSGDVVIVVPGMENEGGGGGVVGGRGYGGHICIDAEQDIEQNSPKTITESSSEYDSKISIDRIGIFLLF